MSTAIHTASRRLCACLIVLVPIAVFGCTYFALGRWPNYLFNDIDTAGVYGLEKRLFGIATAVGTMTPNEFFAAHHCAAADVLAGLFYLCWVPLPVLYALVLLWQGHCSLALRLTSAFLLVNLIGFAGYYIHPTAPPWYVMQHGFEAVIGTPGNVAGFARFDALLHTQLFHGIYGKNANVFAAIPSLHAAYNPVALFYAMKVSRNRAWQCVLATVAVGICVSAVYSGHHYVIDVTLGLVTAALGLLLFERVVLRIPAVARLYGGAERVLTRLAHA